MSVSPCQVQPGHEHEQRMLMKTEFNPLVHSEPHFNDDGLCGCLCRECTGLSWFCLCMDCPCESDDEHHALAMPRDEQTGQSGF